MPVAEYFEMVLKFQCRFQHCVSGIPARCVLFCDHLLCSRFPKPFFAFRARAYITTYIVYLAPRAYFPPCCKFVRLLFFFINNYHFIYSLLSGLATPLSKPECSYGQVEYMAKTPQPMVF